MVTVVNRAQRVLESKDKIESPFALDETLCLYSPQDNVDALAHPRITDWLRFMKTDFAPFKNIAAWHERCVARPAYGKVMAEK